MYNFSLVRLLVSYFAWIFFLIAPVTTFGQSKKNLLIEAQKLIANDAEIQSLKSRYNFSLKHPNFKIHAKLQSVQFQQTYLESTKTIRRKEWRVIGGDVRVLYYPKSNSFFLDKKLYPFNFNFSSDSLLEDTEILNTLPQHLGLSYSLGENQYKAWHRLWPISRTEYLPVLWVQTKGQLEKAGYDLIFNLRNGNLIYKSPRRRRISAADLTSLAPIKVYDGRFHILKSDRPMDKILKYSDRYSQVCQLISTHKESLGEPVIININQCQPGGSDPSAQRAQSNMVEILQYFSLRHSQYGYDNDRNKKTEIRSLVHAGEKYDNAYWDAENEILVYGDGAAGIDRNSTNDYTLALDIAGHEFTHAIISNTADFLTPGDPGALNEAFADIFGVLISRAKSKFNSWSIGAKLYNNADGDSDEIALRSLSQPGKFKTSTRYSQRLSQGEPCTESNDQCEIHANSTIWSHGAYLIAQSFQDQLKFPAEQADQKMAELYFLTLSHRLRQNDDMPSAARALLLTCSETMRPNECQLVRTALRKVELVE